MNDSIIEPFQNQLIEKLVARTFQRLSEPAELLRSLIPVILHCKEVGIDVSPNVRILVKYLLPEIDIIIQIWGEDQIAALYQELASLAAEGNEAEYQESLATLRMLQEAEAKRMTEYFKTNQPLQRGELERAVRKADELLQKYEDPTTSDTTSGCGD